MAINKRLTDTNGVLELNRVSCNKTGNMPSQYKFVEEGKLENGMIVGIKAEKNEIVLDAAAGDAVFLHMSAEKEYDSNNSGLNKFYLDKNSKFLPRLGRLEIGDVFTTTAVCYDSAVLASIEAIKIAVKAGTVYGGVTSVEGYKGLISISKTQPTSKIALKASAVTTVPNGEVAIKFTVVDLAEKV